MSRSPLAAVTLLSCTVALAGCSSSQTRSAQLQQQAKAIAPAQEGLTVTTPSRSVTAASSTVLTDQNGTAVAVELQNTSSANAYDVPVLVALSGDAGAELFTNATPGLQRSLTHAALVPAGGSSWWVNDQVPVTTQPAGSTVTVGDPVGRAPAELVGFTATAPTVSKDQVSGFVAKGFVKHDSRAEQRRVLVTVISRKGKRIVAAGRGIVARVKPGRRAPYTVFFIGQPSGAVLTATAGASLDTQ